jgi:hypothetical protein
METSSACEMLAPNSRLQKITYHNDSASNRNEYKEYFLGVKATGA